MKRFRRILLFVAVASYFTIFTNPSLAQNVNIDGPTPKPINVPGVVVPNWWMGDRIIYPGNEEVTVTAQVGDFGVNISGLASPNASVVLNSEGQFLRSTVADSDGFFYISGISVRKGTSEFCFTSIDFRRLGESESCLTVEPITTSRNIERVFLPPTIGLFRKQINAGEEALIYGYSMPGTTVTVRVREGQTFTVDADAAGYYEYRYKNVPSGTYYLASEGLLEGEKTLPPKKEVELEALSVPAQVTQVTKTTLDNIWDLLTTTIWGFLLILLILLLIIIILILIIKPVWARAIFDKLKRKYPLHHDWLLKFIEENMFQQVGFNYGR
jgi:hypothetical protein